MTTIWPRPWSRDRPRAAPCSQCRRARKRTPAASPGPACSRRTTPTLLHVLRKNGAEHPGATAGQAQKVRSKIRVASAFLDWLADHERDLTTAGQADLDLWLVTHRPDLARDLSPFLSWARQRRLCGPLAVPRRPRAEPPARPY